MRILVSNDDGFHAEGIQVLATELRKLQKSLLLHPIVIEVQHQARSHWLSHYAHAI